MKQYLFGICGLLLVFSTVHGMQRVNIIPRLARSYRADPLVDALKRSILRYDVKQVLERLQIGFPTKLDHQYTLLGLETSDEITQLLLSNIYSYWATQLKRDPTRCLSSLERSCEILTRTYGIAGLNTLFLKMFTQLKNDASAFWKIKAEKHLAERLCRLPEYVPLPLALLSARVVGRLDCEEELTGDYQDLINQANQRISVAPLLYQNSLEVTH